MGRESQPSPPSSIAMVGLREFPLARRLNRSSIVAVRWHGPGSIFPGTRDLLRRRSESKEGTSLRHPCRSAIASHRLTERPSLIKGNQRATTVMLISSAPTPCFDEFEQFGAKSAREHDLFWGFLAGKPQGLQFATSVQRHTRISADVGEVTWTGAPSSQIFNRPASQPAGNSAYYPNLC